jgi:predicted histidine transporter YuiF (NhaC family)
MRLPHLFTYPRIFNSNGHMKTFPFVNNIKIKLTYAIFGGLALTIFASEFIDYFHNHVIGS